ncbi:MAG: hypothetical protein JWM36_4348 [Hyphomicrobiales bacterium]|nr:hypothetical protein [Hyphomicrobiales bacterium]
MAVFGPISGDVPVDWVPITPSASPLARPVRAIRANGAGTVTVTTGADASRVMNFLAGETRLIYATYVTAATAAGLEGAV